MEIAGPLEIEVVASELPSVDGIAVAPLVVEIAEAWPEERSQEDEHAEGEGILMRHGGARVGGAKI